MNFGFGDKPKNQTQEPAKKDAFAAAKAIKPQKLEDQPPIPVGPVRTPSSREISQEPPIGPTLKNDGSKQITVQLGPRLTVPDHERFIALSKRLRLSYGDLIKLFLDEFEVDMDGKNQVTFRTLGN